MADVGELVRALADETVERELRALTVERVDFGVDLRGRPLVWVNGRAHPHASLADAIEFLIREKEAANG